jgi:hypothetical protein
MKKQQEFNKNLEKVWEEKFKAFQIDKISSTTVNYNLIQQ